MVMVDSGAFGCAGWSSPGLQVLALEYRGGKKGTLRCIV